MKTAKRKSFFTPKSDNPAFGPSDDSGDQAAKQGREFHLEGLRSAAPILSYSHLRENQSDYGPIYVAVKVLKAQASSAVMKAYRWHEDAKVGGDLDAKEYLPRNHPICKFFRRPNRWDSGRRMIARAVEQRCLTGSWLAWRVDDGVPWTDEYDRPRELWTVPTGLYTPVPMSSQYPDGAYRIMTFYPGPMSQIPGTWNAGGVIVDANQMIVSRFTHPLTYKEALSPLWACGAELDTINLLGNARKSLLRRMPQPSGVVEIDTLAQFPDTPTLNRLMQQIYQYIGGPDRAGKPAILGPGMKWKAEDLKGMELPWSDSWDQMLSFVYTVFGMTKNIVGMSESASYAALYAALKHFRLGTLQPELDDIADDFNMQIVEKFWGDEYGIEFEPGAVGDDELQEKRLTLDLQAGIRTFDEWRVVRNLVKIGGDKGKEWVGGADAMKKAGQQVGGQGQPELGHDKTGPVPSTEHEMTHSAVKEEPRPKNKAGGGSIPPRIVPRLSSRNGVAKRR